MAPALLAQERRALPSSASHLGSLPAAVAEAQTDCPSSLAVAQEQPVMCSGSTVLDSELPWL